MLRDGARFDNRRHAGVLAYASRDAIVRSLLLNGASDATLNRLSQGQVASGLPPLTRVLTVTWPSLFPANEILIIPSPGEGYAKEANNES